MAFDTPKIDLLDFVKSKVVSLKILQQIDSYFLTKSYDATVDTCSLQHTLSSPECLLNLDWPSTCLAEPLSAF